MNDKKYSVSDLLLFNESPFAYWCKTVNNLVENGTKEIILLGQNVNAYFYKNEKGDIINFGLLLFYLSRNNCVEFINF